MRFALATVFDQIVPDSGDGCCDGFAVPGNCVLEEALFGAEDEEESATEKPEICVWCGGDASNRIPVGSGGEM